jgi:hypothetical protein
MQIRRQMVADGGHRHLFSVQSRLGGFYGTHSSGLGNAQQPSTLNCSSASRQASF